MPWREVSVMDQRREFVRLAMRSSSAADFFRRGCDNTRIDALHWLRIGQPPFVKRDDSIGDLVGRCARRNKTGPSGPDALSPSNLSEFLRFALGQLLEDIAYEADMASGGAVAAGVIALILLKPTKWLQRRFNDPAAPNA